MEIKQGILTYLPNGCGILFALSLVLLSSGNHWKLYKIKYLFTPKRTAAEFYGVQKVFDKHSEGPQLFTGHHYGVV